MKPTEYLRLLQTEAQEAARMDKNKAPDFHYGLKVWVGDESSLARALRKMEDEQL